MYISIKDKVYTSEIVINKSRFLGFATHVESEQEASVFLATIKKDHKLARHVCYAYRLQNTSKASDDGEPSGTAGKPILQVLEKQNLQNTIVVVVRYFGGIKLGAGGLLRAYTSATIECLSVAEKLEYHKSYLYTLRLEYKDYKNFLNSIKNRKIEILETNFDNGAELKIVAQVDEKIDNAIKIGEKDYYFA